MSAWLRPIWGRDLGSELSILTTRVGRAATAGSVTGRPVSGYTGGGGGGVVGGVVVVVVVLVVVVVAGAAPSDRTCVATMPDPTSRTTTATAAVILPRGVASSARTRGPRPPRTEGSGVGSSSLLATAQERDAGPDDDANYPSRCDQDAASGAMAQPAVGRAARLASVRLFVAVRPSEAVLDAVAGLAR